MKPFEKLGSFAAGKPFDVTSLRNSPYSRLQDNGYFAIVRPRTQPAHLEMPNLNAHKPASGVV
jgi:hypothetical protein